MIDLDQSVQFRDVDTRGMLDRLMGLPDQIRDAWGLVQGLSLPSGHAKAANIVICGMGGSAIGGDLIRSLAEREARVPIAVVRGYDLPAYVDERSLVIVSSFSGATEETLGNCEQALRVGAHVVAVTTGGALAGRAWNADFPLVRFEFPGQPREALGYSVLLMLGVLCRLGYVADRTAEVEAATRTLEGMQNDLGPDVPSDENSAKRLAQRMFGKTGLIYAGGLLAEAARRWKGQLNENAKHWAFFEQLPELNHNAVLGYQFPTDVSQRTFVVMLSSSLNHPRISLRGEVTAELLARWGIPNEVVNARGETPLEHVLSTTYMGDFVSYYLALINDVDLSNIDTIVFFKERLERASGE